MLDLRTMNRMFTIAVVACVILLILTIFISPVIDLQPTALRAQQWLSLIFAMFAFALQIIVCVVPVLFCILVPRRNMPFLHQTYSANLTSCLLC